MNIPILYEDEWLMAVNKPSGLLTIPTPKNEARTLTSILDADAKEKGVTYRLHPCHRLDRESSGVIIYAKGKALQKKIMELFNQKKVTKTYIAFVQGAPDPAAATIRSPLEGKNAVTRYRILERRKEFSVVEVMPLTGRTNQIRIHFKQIGHPLVGETKFAFRKDYALRAKRLCLHAQGIRFPHPVTHQEMELNADLPAELADFLQRHP